jgi:hypothetical protein
MVALEGELAKTVVALDPLRHAGDVLVGRGQGIAATTASDEAAASEASQPAREVRGEGFAAAVALRPIGEARAGEDPSGESPAATATPSTAAPMPSALPTPGAGFAGLLSRYRNLDDSEAAAWSPGIPDTPGVAISPDTTDEDDRPASAEAAAHKPDDDEGKRGHGLLRKTEIAPTATAYSMHSPPSVARASAPEATAKESESAVVVRRRRAARPAKRVVASAEMPKSRSATRLQKFFGEG